LLLHNFCIYHISPPGHEVCNLSAYLSPSWFSCLHFSNISFIECYNSHHFFLQELLQLGAAAISPDKPVLSVDDLADQIEEVLNFFG
jgi:hypothetical protein